MNCPNDAKTAGIEEDERKGRKLCLLSAKMTTSFSSWCANNVLFLIHSR